MMNQKLPECCEVRPLVNPKFPFFWHGGDYNPDQWRHIPGTVDLDFKLMKEAGINSVSVGIFAWAALEPEEDRFEFGWLDDIMDRAAEAGMAVVLATPTGGKPTWMGAKYEEVRRMVRINGSEEFPPMRAEQYRRHNHCMSSPYYRKKTAQIDRLLAERYAKHPALALFHIGNEFAGECHCPLCYENFRMWLKNKYKTLDALNAAWWCNFWAHTITDWSQITTIDQSVEGMVLDWRRFTSENSISFIKAEADILHEFAPGIPVTTNYMGFIRDINGFRLSECLDVISWDCYPAYHDRPDSWGTGHQAMIHDSMRSYKNKPFLMMESCPGPTNWMRINRLLRPGQHRAKSLQAVAHGSDSVQYFQIHKGRGGCEKFHGAVIDHCGEQSPNTRMFKEVQALSEDLKALQPLLGGATPSESALVYDWDCQWALNNCAGPNAFSKNYNEITRMHYDALRCTGVCMDIVEPMADWSKYKLVLTPALYLLQPGYGAKARSFVEQGGILVATHNTGWVNETHLTHDHGFPGDGFRELFGIWDEETDYLYEDEFNELCFEENAPKALASRRMVLSNVCARIHAEGSTEVWARYGKDFYAGEPAVTCNRVGKGAAIYLASHIEDHNAISDVYAAIADMAGVTRYASAVYTRTLDVTVRTAADGSQWLFVINPTGKEETLKLGDAEWKSFDSEQRVCGEISAPAYSTQIFIRG